MHCLSCPVASAETLAEAAEVHGIDVDEMLLKLNEFNDAHPYEAK
jgi:hybrid cluster-associated redox disulfide protein